MTDFPTLSHIPTYKIPTPSDYLKLEKAPLPAAASPYMTFFGVPHPLTPSDLVPLGQNNYLSLS